MGMHMLVVLSLSLKPFHVSTCMNYFAQAVCENRSSLRQDTQDLLEGLGLANEHRGTPKSWPRKDHSHNVLELLQPWREIEQTSGTTW